MKKAILMVMGMMGVVGLASASNNFSYTATASPGSNPDGIDQSSNPLQVWTAVFTPGTSGGAGTEYITSWANNYWGEYSYNNASGGSEDASDTFAGGALTIGQTVSINFGNSAVATGQQVGLSILDGSAQDIDFSFTGGDPNGVYRYSDAAVTGQSTGLGYEYQSVFNIAITVTGADTYSAIAGSDSWSGTFSGSLTGIDVFNHAAGDDSDVAFNDLTVSTPEPSVLGLASVGGALLLGFQRRHKIRK